MHERSIEERVTAVEVALEHFQTTGADFRRETKAELSDIRKDNRMNMRLIIAVLVSVLASIVTVGLGWGLQLLFDRPPTP